MNIEQMIPFSATVEVLVLYFSRFSFKELINQSLAHYEHTFLSSRSRLGVRLIVMQMVETHMCVPYSRAEDRRLHTYSMECREAMEGFVSF